MGKPQTPNEACGERTRRGFKPLLSNDNWRGRMRVGYSLKILKPYYLPVACGGNTLKSISLQKFMT